MLIVLVITAKNVTAVRFIFSSSNHFNMTPFFCDRARGFAATRVDRLAPISPQRVEAALRLFRRVLRSSDDCRSNFFRRCVCRENAKQAHPTGHSSARRFFRQKLIFCFFEASYVLQEFSIKCPLGDAIVGRLLGKV
jgi:hypothetical protein